MQAHPAARAQQALGGAAAGERPGVGSGRHDELPIGWSVARPASNSGMVRPPGGVSQATEDQRDEANAARQPGGDSPRVASRFAARAYPLLRRGSALHGRLCNPGESHGAGALKHRASRDRERGLGRPRCSNHQDPAADALPQVSELLWLCHHGDRAHAHHYPACRVRQPDADSHVLEPSHSL